MFDKVTLLYEGRQIYFGPINAAKQYFLGLGFNCADLATTADFLTSLTNPAERNVREGYELRVPRTPKSFERVWRASADRARLVQEIRDTQQNFPNEAEALLRLEQARKVEKMTRRCVAHLIIDLYGSANTMLPTDIPLTRSLFLVKLKYALSGAFKDCVRTWLSRYQALLGPLSWARSPAVSSITYNLTLAASIVEGP